MLHVHVVSCLQGRLLRTWAVWRSWGLGCSSSPRVIEVDRWCLDVSPLCPPSRAVVGVTASSAPDAVHAPRGRVQLHVGAAAPRRAIPKGPYSYSLLSITNMEVV